ncbi:MAG: hypothetical protein JO256_05200 [Alphaproteobacteria bacterium]|nr:hypothetical protein [Alphaproteobacteria bacterium]
MEFHKPKPIHNWRELLTEIGVIVIGVAIALTAEQGVEWLHWKGRVRDAVEAMRLELRDDDGPQAYTRMAMRTCFDRQLDAIQSAIESGRPRTEIVGLINLYVTPTPTWDSNAWNAVISSDVGSHVPPIQMMSWSGPYVFVPSLASRNEQERDDRIALRPTRSSGEKLSAGEADVMLSAIARLRSDNGGMNGRSSALLIAMKRNGITLRDDQQNGILQILRKRFGECVVVPSLVPVSDAQLGFPRMGGLGGALPSLGQ